MKKFFYSFGGNKQGPVYLEELIDANITNETLIWFEGLPQWTPAGKIEELVPILELIPPPIPDQSQEKFVEETRASIAQDHLITQMQQQPQAHRKNMFSKPFSFEGRIKRTEYLFSILIYYALTFCIGYIIGSVGLSDGTNYGMAYIYLGSILPAIFLLAQGAKRCHDIGRSGWFQLIPFYIFWMIFSKGHYGMNQYGEDPKSSDV